jgi:hydrogenase-4 component B
MMKNDTYVDVWPEKLDLENAIYRPLLLKVLPTVFTFICRILDRFLDNIIVFLRKTIYCDSPIPQELKEGNFLTHLLGRLEERAVHLMNQTVWLDQPREENQEHKLAVRYERMSENNTIIARSLSFGLMMSLMGLVAVLIYLLIRV